MNPLCLGLFRSDYMLDKEIDIAGSNRIKQVEINTISISFGGLSPKISHAHRFILRKLGYGQNELQHLPENNALTGLCSAMVQAWKLYGNTKSVILFVVENLTYNICDQRYHEYELYRLDPSVCVIRKTLTDIGHQGCLRNNALFIDDKEVAVVYYRAGYTPDHYFGELEWEARLMIERSTAIKCPSIYYHLAGTKKVQQTLYSREVLKKFLIDENKIDLVRDTFTGLYSLDMNADGDRAVEMALKNPNEFVLKPQREGGGNNLYGEDVAAELRDTFSSKKRTSYILMRRIQPPVQQNYIIRPEEPFPPKILDIVSELGIFGVIVGDKDTILENKQVGHVVRSKMHSAYEGGVHAGVGSLDSPFLI